MADRRHSETTDTGDGCGAQGDEGATRTCVPAVVLGHARPFFLLRLPGELSGSGREVALRPHVHGRFTPGTWVPGSGQRPDSAWRLLSAIRPPGEQAPPGTLASGSGAGQAPVHRFVVLIQGGGTDDEPQRRDQTRFGQHVDRLLLSPIELGALLWCAQQDRHDTVGTGHAADLTAVAVDEHRHMPPGSGRPAQHHLPTPTLDTGSDRPARADSPPCSSCLITSTTGRRLRHPDDWRVSNVSRGPEGWETLQSRSASSSARRVRLP